MSDVNQLRGQLRSIENQIFNLRQNILKVDDTVGAIEQQQQATRNDLVELRLAFARFAQQAERTANVHRAETAIGALKNDIEHQFGHHKVVRRTAVGMLQSFDVGLVSEDTVQAVGEQLMIQTPRYWLAPVLVALAAWVGDDPDLCVRAVEEAYRRSPERTSLLMTLILRRQGRRASAVRWLRHYLDAQDPAALNREFALILEAIAHGAFGPDALTLTRERLESWRRTLLADEASTHAQLNRWRREMETFVRPEGLREDFPRLGASSPQWPQLERALAGAEAHQSIIDRYVAVLNTPPSPTDRIEDAIDDLLDMLVEEYDPEELPLRRELAAKEAIVAADGDLEEAARSTPFQLAALKDVRDYLTIQTDSALDPDGIGVSPQTQRLALAFCHDWLSDAHSAFTRDYRLGLPSTVTVTLDLRERADVTGFKPPPWTGSFERPLDALERSLTSHWTRHTEPFLAGLAFDWRKRIIAPIVVLLLVAVFGSAVAGLAVGLVITVGGGVAWGLLLRAQADSAAEKQNAARARLAAARKRSLVELRAAGAELTDWTTRFTDADSRESNVRALIADLATAGAPGSPHERRVPGRAEEA
ncbi:MULTISPECIES: hypothetical protein [Micromonospora]|uniref:hypothetical protein n=1 Tax=Micromonospora TaxID=1873 RepID=UPI000CE50243|nr:MULTISPECIES: hypothetical protein [Micromonospora]MBP1783353.1 hypothetical protein [Micromonospora sp. HB375]MDH6469002.1 hypothetical protein [Micromonospora sp. H404/HB375]PPA60729.1 hypothetical protein BAW75_10625 [Micromonospora chalcea]